MVKQLRAWHAIIAFGQHKQSNDISHGMPSSPLDGKHGRTTLGVAFHHGLWAAQMVGRRRALHAIIAFGQHTQSNDIGHGMSSSPLGITPIERCQAFHAIIAFGRQTRSNDIRRGMQSSPLGSTDSQTASGVTCHHCPWTAHTIGNVGRGMTSPPLDGTHGQTTSGVE